MSRQVVSGQRYIITMRLGVSDKSECKEAAKDQIVSSADCSHAENVSFNFYQQENFFSSPRSTSHFTVESFIVPFCFMVNSNMCQQINDQSTSERSIYHNSHVTSPHM
jgi:hypothetical protein